MTRRPTAQRGFTLLEVLAALAIFAMITAGAAAMIGGALDDMRGQHAGQHQAKVTEAADRYVRENYAALVTSTAAAPVAVPVATLAGLLPDGFEPANAFGQVPCVRVMQPVPGRLNILVMAEGGTEIPTKDLAYVAAQAGPGGGMVAPDDPTVAKGAFGSWRVAAAPYGAAACGPASGGPITNRLASALFFDSPSTGTDFLYRGEVPGRPELNALSVPLAMTGRAIAVEGDTADPLCSVADPLAMGRIAVSATGDLLTCQAGTWRRQGSAFWKDPVASFALLPMVGNLVGETRLTLDTSRAFSWDGSGWRALAVDALGDLDVPRQMTLSTPVVRGTACSPVGAISRELTGRTLSCQGGVWQSASTTEIDPSQSQQGGTVILRSNYVAYPGGTDFYAGPFTYEPGDDTTTAVVERVLVPNNDGLIISNVNAAMSVDDPVAATNNGQFVLTVRVVDLDSGNIIAANRAMSPRIVNDQAMLAVTLSKAVPRNTNGYAFQMLVEWTRYQGSNAGNFYDRAYYVNALGGIEEITPLEMSWSIDLTY